MKCRHCHTKLNIPFANLGSAPLSNAYLSDHHLNTFEKWYPLKVLVCSNCWLVQTEDYAGRDEIFSSEYAYLSSYSTTWLNHCKNYVTKMIERFGLNKNSLVGEIASNDGYLLQYFLNEKIPCFGVEPTESTAKLAREKGIKIFTDFFGIELANKLVNDDYAADLLIANNVLAHVPDINDFVSGFKFLLKPEGIATFEFPHLYRLVSQSQFDTIYHEHFSYLSLTTVKTIFESNGLSIFDVEELPTHGGSLRVYAQRTDTGKHTVTQNVNKLLQFERDAGMTDFAFYAEFQERIVNIKHHLVAFLLKAQKNNEQVIGYGAAAKGNTLLNFSGIRSDLLSYVVDKSHSKQGKYLPGSRIPIISEKQVSMDKPAWIMILPWNLQDEVAEQLSYVREWGAKFVIAIPSLTVF